MDVPWEKPAPGQFTKQAVTTNRPVAGSCQFGKIA
jgi:hypothetical protein